jgi:hypothetical protein
MTAVTNNNASWWLTPAQTATSEMNELMQTNAFIRAVIQQTDLEAEMNKGQARVDEVIAETRKSIWAYALGDNQVLIGSAHEQPRVSYQLVLAVIEGYVQWQINAKRAESESAHGFFDDLLVRYESNLETAREEMRHYLQVHPEPIRGDRPSLEQLELARLQSEIDLAASRYSSALDKEENVQLSLAQIESEARQSYMLIDAPRLPEEPSTSLKELAMNAAIFLVAGFAITGVMIAGAAVLDRSFRFPVDVEQRLHLPVLALLPDTTPPRGRFLRRRQPQAAPAGKTLPAKSKQPRRLVWKPVTVKQISRNHDLVPGIGQEERQEQAAL